MSLQVLAKACEREVVETVPTAPIFLEGDVGLEAKTSGMEWFLREKLLV